MAVSSGDVDERVRDFVDECKRRDVRVTHQRIEIFRELASTEAHPDAEAIYRRVRERMPTISLDTVYRNLRMLADQGLVAIVGMSHERIRFDANMGRHHHFVCTRCGKIRDFTSETIGALEVPDEARAFGEPRSLHVEVKGLCRDCGQDTNAVKG